jgi:hypothetical protein
MGLDATVYCNCFEKGLLREPPPADLDVVVEESGFVTFLNKEVSNQQWDWFDSWKLTVCEHPDFIVLTHRLGNISLIGLLRHELSASPQNFPILLKRVVYNGIHASDHIPYDLIPSLEIEVERLKSFKCARSKWTDQLQKRWPSFGASGRFMLRSVKNDLFVQYFREQMEELIAAAKEMQKPIAF